MVAVFGYTRNETNSNIVSYDRAKNGLDVFVEKMLDPLYDILLNVGKADEMGHMSAVERYEAGGRGIDIEAALRRGSSDNTWENAAEIVKIAKEEGVSKIYLSTSKNHMKRAVDYVEAHMRKMGYVVPIERRPSSMNAYVFLSPEKIRKNTDFEYNKFAQEIIPVGPVKVDSRVESKNLSV